MFLNKYYTVKLTFDKNQSERVKFVRFKPTFVKLDPDSPRKTSKKRPFSDILHQLISPK